MQVSVIMVSRIKFLKFVDEFLLVCMIACIAEGHTADGRDGRNNSSVGNYQNLTNLETGVNYTNGREVAFTGDSDVPVEQGNESSSTSNQNETFWNGCTIIQSTVESNCSYYVDNCVFETKIGEHILSIELMTSNLNESCYRFDVGDTGIQGSSFCDGVYRVTTCQGCIQQTVNWKTVSSLLPYQNYRQYFSRRQNVVYRLTNSCEANINYGEDQVGFWVTEECKDAVPFYCGDQDVITEENLPVIYKSGSTSDACLVYETIVDCKVGECPILDTQNIKPTLVYIARLSDNSLDYGCLAELSKPLKNVITCSHVSESLRILTCDDCEWSTMKCERDGQDKTYCVKATDDLIHYNLEETLGCRKGDTISRDENGVYIQASCLSVEVELLKCNDKALVNNIFSTVSTAQNTTVTSTDTFSSTSKIDHGSSPTIVETTFTTNPTQMSTLSIVSPRVESQLNSSNDKRCLCSLCLLECTSPISANFSVQNITAELLIDSSTTAKSKRKKISVPDNRPTAVTIGSFGIICIVSVVAILLSTDCVRVVRNLKKMVKRKGS